MKVYTDNEGRILAVGSTDDESLIEHEITDNTFDGWSDAKIMCYRVYVDSEGNVTMMTPRIDSREIRRIDAPNKGTQIVDEKVEGVKQNTDDNSINLADMASTLSDVYMELCELEMNLM